MTDQPAGDHATVPPDPPPVAHVDPPPAASQPALPAPPAADRPWYRDPPKLVGVLGFLLAFGTLGERVWVRDQELTQERLQLLRDATATLADIQADYIEDLAAAPANVYSLGVARNTKRQMYLQTAAALLEHPGVRREASAQILGALAGEFMTDGRYEPARAYFAAAEQARGADDAIRPFLLRALGQLHRIPNTTFADEGVARDYFERALSLLDRRRDDTGHLSWAETVLTEANLELVYGTHDRARELANRATERLQQVRSVSPLKHQLERIAAAVIRGEQFPQTQDPVLQTASPVPPATMSAAATSHANTAAGTRAVTVEVWNQIPGQISGVDMTVAIDDTEIGALSNVGGAVRLEVKELSPGIHEFTFGRMSAYFIDPVKGPVISGSGFSCRGFFEVTAATLRLRANVGSGPNGIVCGLHS